MAELQKHPYHSISFCMLIHVEKPGTGIFLDEGVSKVAQTAKRA
jgi:hypothetical protein